MGRYNIRDAGQEHVERLPEPEDEDEEKERDDEPTQVTQIYSELNACVEEAGESLDRASEAADEVERVAKNPQSHPKLKLALSSRPPPPKKAKAKNGGDE